MIYLKKNLIFQIKKELDRIAQSNGNIFSVIDISTSDGLSFCINYKSKIDHKNALNFINFKESTKKFNNNDIKEKIEVLIYESTEKIWFGYSINPSKINLYSDLEKHFAHLNSIDANDHVACMAYMKSIGCLFVGGRGVLCLYKYFNSALYFVKSIKIEEDESILQIEIIKSNLTCFVTEKKLQLWSITVVGASFIPKVSSSVLLNNKSNSNC